MNKIEITSGNNKKQEATSTVHKFMVLNSSDSEVKPYIDRILVFSGGGLVSAVFFSKNKAEILIDWPETMTLQSMKLVAKILNMYRETGQRVIFSGLWVAYIPEQSEYIVMAKLKNKRYLLSAVGLVRRISKELEGIPEETNLIGELIVKLFKKHFKVDLEAIKKRYRMGQSTG